VFQVMFIFQPAQEIVGPEPGVCGLHFTPMGIGRIGANVDLCLSLRETDQGLGGALEYRTELFDPDTIEELSANYAEILKKAVAEPETKISEFGLSEILAAKAARARLREQEQLIAISATFTAELVEEALKFWMEKLDIPSRIDFAPYNQVFQDLLDPNGLLAGNRQGMNVVLVRFEDWLHYEPAQETRGGALSSSSIQKKIARHADDLIRALRVAAGRALTPYMLFLCPSSPESNTDLEQRRFFERMEGMIAAELADERSIYIVGSARLASVYPVADYYDSYADEEGHVPFTQTFFAGIGTYIARTFQALRTLPFKVVVLDCDETLWKGVLAEDGPMGITIDLREGMLQEYVLAQHDVGILVCLCSKNNQEDVFEVFAEHPEMRLRREHLAGWRINWRPKSENLRSLAEELQVGLESFIFIDNDPVECREVQAHCPEVLVLQLPRGEEETRLFLKHVWAFDRIALTEEDRRRTALYQQNRLRQRSRQESVSLEEFFQGLNLHIEIRRMTRTHCGRVAQLTQRTNQFNTTTTRCSEAEVAGIHDGQGDECWVVEVSDRFGDYGLVGVMIFGNRGYEALEVRTMLLSCRALGRGVEHRMMSQLGSIAADRGQQRVDLFYEPSNRNAPALAFLEEVGGAFKEASGTGYLFKIPAKAAAEVKHQKGTHGGDLSWRQESRGGLKATALPGSMGQNSALMQQIAAEWNNAESIRRTIEAQKQRSSFVRHGNYAAPQTPTEAILAEVWIEVLGVSQVGIHDDFFKLGGHSLLGTVVISRIRSSFGVEVHLLDLFDSPTVTQLAEHIDLRLIQQTDPDQMTELIDGVERLSEEEIKALLERDSD